MDLIARESNRLNRFVTDNARFINAGICFLFAAYLLWTALSAWLGA